jgi:undecaprenyl diphosphate synthase
MTTQARVECANKLRCLSSNEQLFPTEYNKWHLVDRRPNRRRIVAVSLACLLRFFPHPVCALLCPTSGSLQYTGNRCSKWTTRKLISRRNNNHCDSSTSTWLHSLLSRNITTFSSFAVQEPLTAAPAPELQSNPTQSTHEISNATSSKTELSSDNRILLRVPKHVAIVCDGNARWAQQRGLPSVAGHAAGAERLVQVVRALQRTPGVSHCTVYGFSTENWQRSSREISDIFTVMEQTVRRFSRTFLDENLILKVIGDLDDERIPYSLRDCMRQLERATQSKHGAANVVEQSSANGNSNAITLCLAINYGGRQDLINASRKLAVQIANGSLDPSCIDETSIAACLDTADIPNPDLWIRTSGEYRLSNFLLWDSAYAELYFTETLWPDFDATQLQSALDWYAQRHRRFGSRQNH